jgi:hypothetical protein
MNCRYAVFCFAMFGAFVSAQEKLPEARTWPDTGPVGYSSTYYPPVNSDPMPVNNFSPVQSNLLPGFEAQAKPAKKGAVSFSYIVSESVSSPAVRTPNGETPIQKQTYQRLVTSELELDCDLSKIDLPGDGTRIGVQAVTAARHNKLLQALKEAKSESEKEDASKKLEENYRAHYAIETDWRMKRLAELEKRLEEMRSQVKERADSESKYVEAAMTLAKLHAQGIAAEPPRLMASPLPGGYATSSGSYGQISPYSQPSLPAR